MTIMASSDSVFCGLWHPNPLNLRTAGYAQAL